MLLIVSGLACAATGISEEKIEASHKWLEKGKSLSRSGKHQDAIKAYDKAIELNPMLDKAYNNRGNVYFDKQEYDKAIDDYSRSIELNPRQYKVYSNRGVAYRLMERFDRAVKDYTRAIKLAPRYYPAYYNRGIAYHYKKQYTKAVEDYSRAIKVNPRFDKAFNNDSLWFIQQSGKADEDFKKAQEIIKKYGTETLWDTEAVWDVVRYSSLILDLQVDQLGGNGITLRR